MSRALLDKVRAAARGKDSVTELLRLAHAMAQHSRCIPQALLHFRRELCAALPEGLPCPVLPIRLWLTYPWAAGPEPDAP